MKPAFDVFLKWIRLLKIWPHFASLPHYWDLKSREVSDLSTALQPEEPKAPEWVYTSSMLLNSTYWILPAGDYSSIFVWFWLGKRSRYMQQCSAVSLSSEFRNYSYWCSVDHMECHESNLARLMQGKHLTYCTISLQSKIILECTLCLLLFFWYILLFL